MSLRTQAKEGLFWTFLQQFGTQIISFTVGLVLARLLLPSDFGAIAMFTVVIAIVTSIADGGLASSLIRTKTVDDNDYSTVFWFNITISVMLYGIIYTCAPLIADFYKVKVLISVIRIYSLSVIINSFVTIQKTIMTINLDFKKQFKIQLPALILGGSIGVLLAYKGYGIWSLVAHYLVQNTISTILFWLVSSWRPTFVFNKEKFLYHFKFGYKLTLSGLIDTIFTNVYTIIIGKFFSPALLGYYNRADTLKQLPVSNLSVALNNVTFPLFAKISDNDKKLKEVYQKLMKVVVFIIAPILCYMIVIAEPMIRFLLTEKWLPAVPFFQVLAIAGILYPIHSYNLNILKVKGRSDLFLLLEVWKKLLIVVVLVFSFQFGIMGLVWGQVVISILAFFINTYYTAKILNYGSLQQIKDLVPTLIMAGALYYLFHELDRIFLQNWSDLARILIIGLGYIIAFFGSTSLLQFKEIQHIKELLKK